MNTQPDSPSKVITRELQFSLTASIISVQYTVWYVFVSSLQAAKMSAYISTDMQDIFKAARLPEDVSEVDGRGKRSKVA
jgi:hypothetical protein